MTDTDGSWHSQYQTIGMDIDATYPAASKILGLGNDVDLKQDQVNYKIWTAASSIQNGLSNGGGASGIWGFRKQLLKEGHGTLEYLLVDPTSYMNRKAVAIDTIVYPDPGGTTYVIPDYIIVRTSTIPPTLTCDTNATPSVTLDINGQPVSCACIAGYYGNGSVCAICPQNAYCTTGVSTWTACPNGGITGVPGATTVNACYAACATAPGGTTVSIGTTTNPGQCSCNAGYYGTGAVCAQCLAGTYSSAGETGSSVTGCPSCGQGSSTSPNGNTTAGGNGATACPQCAVGYYSNGTKNSSCPICTNGKGTGQNTPGARDCTACPAGKYGSPTAATGVCNSCVTNRYTAGTGSTNINQCLNCPAGSSTATPGLLSACTACPSNQSSLAGQNCLDFAGAAALTQYQNTNAPCQGVWQLSLPASPCPTTCPFAGGPVAGAVYTWSTSVAAGTGGNCPQALQGTSSAAPVSCGANNCPCTGGYTLAGAPVACPTTCGYAGNASAPGITYTWQTTAPKTGTGQCLGETTQTTSASTQNCSIVPITTCMPITLTCMGGTGAAGPATVTYSPNPLGITLSGGIQVWTVPVTRTYKFVVTGAGSNLGASVSGSISLTVGQIVYCVVGQVYGSGGGGGGSFVFIGTPSTSVPFIAAGGAGHCISPNADMRTNSAAPLNLTGTANAGAGGGGFAGSAGGNGGSPYACAGGGSGGGAYGIISLLTNFSISTAAFGGVGVASGSCTPGGGGYSGGGGGCGFAAGGGGGSFINNGGSTWTGTSIVQSASASGSIVIS